MDRTSREVMLSTASQGIILHTTVFHPPFNARILTPCHPANVLFLALGLGEAYHASAASIGYQLECDVRERCAGRTD